MFRLWHPLFPVSFRYQVYQGVVLPKLEAAVVDWNPRVAPMMHLWLLPWIPLLGDTYVMTIVCFSFLLCCLWSPMFTIFSLISIFPNAVQYDATVVADGAAENVTRPATVVTA